LGRKGGEWIWIQTALMSWIFFGVYWFQLDWRASRKLEKYEQQSVRVLLRALDELAVNEPYAKSSGSDRIVPIAQASFSPRRTQKKVIADRSLNLNVIDSASLEALPRIGPEIAGRICRFREALGGFYSVDQLQEVWGMHPDQVEAIIPWFQVGSGVFRHLCVDSASYSQLRAHPYIRFKGANTITAYRSGNGLEQVEDLKGAIPISDSLFRRWSPYLRVCKFNENVIEARTSE
jgi:DNA uptake protein ComE-like DNA-binding protein